MPTRQGDRSAKNSRTLPRLTRLRITTAPSPSTPWISNTDFAISKPIVITSPMDGSPQVVRFDATTLWHLDAAEWAPSTASIIVGARSDGCATRQRLTEPSPLRLEAFKSGSQFARGAICSFGISAARSC